MNITKNVEGEKVVITLDGALDTQTAPALDKELEELFPQMTELIFDLKNLQYVSSAGLRVLLQAQKKMNKKGKMEVYNAQPTVMEVFSVTGLTKILTLK